MILAQQVLGLFEECGATPQEQRSALEIVQTVVSDRIYDVNALPLRSAE